MRARHLLGRASGERQRLSRHLGEEVSPRPRDGRRLARRPEPRVMAMTAPRSITNKGVASQSHLVLLALFALVVAACGSSGRRGGAGEVCYPNGTCNAGLECSAGTCGP